MGGYKGNKEDRLEEKAGGEAEQETREERCVSPGETGRNGEKPKDIGGNTEGKSFRTNRTAGPAAPKEQSVRAGSCRARSRARGLRVINLRNIESIGRRKV